MLVHGVGGAEVCRTTYSGVARVKLTASISILVAILAWCFFLGGDNRKMATTSWWCRVRPRENQLGPAIYWCEISAINIYCIRKHELTSRLLYYL